jgi:signal transduction histidine kinase
VFRIVQEALTNAARHARASQVEVAIDADAEAITVTVSDDGAGFDASSPSKPHSYGLLGLRERAYLLGGEAQVNSQPGRGTEIEVRLPLHPAEAPA